MRTRILEAALDVGLGRTYGHSGEDATDCVQFAEALLHVAYPALDWSGTHPSMMIMDPTRLWSNVEQLVALGFREASRPQPGRWAYVQGWRSSGAGHCFLWWAQPSPVADADRLLEATNATSDWYRPASWEEQRARYDRGVRLVILEEAT